MTARGPTAGCPTDRARAHEQCSSSSARLSATCRSRRSSAWAASDVAHEIGTMPRSRPVTNTTCPLEPLGAVERDEVDAVAAAASRAGGGVEPGGELGDAARAADRVEIVAAELEQRVAMRARLVGDVAVAVGVGVASARRTSAAVGVGGEIGEVVRERAARRVALGFAELVEQRRAPAAAPRSAAPSPMRNGTPRRVNAASKRDDCAFVRNSTAMRCHGTPSAWLVPARVGDRARLGVVVVVGRDRRRRRRRAGSLRVASRRSPAAEPERGLGERDDRGRAAVVAAERDRRAAGEGPVERDERRRVGAREAVDRLAPGRRRRVRSVRVAEPRAQQPELQRRRVLELVDEEVAEPPALPGRELLVARDRVGAPAEHVVEVDAGAGGASRPRTRA